MTTAIALPVSTPESTSSDPNEERGVIRDASWNFYERLTESLGEGSPFRVAFDGRDIEIMTLGPKHEDIRDLLNQLVNDVYFLLDIDCRGLGSTTWKRFELGRGIEADLCFYFEPAKLQVGELATTLDSNNVADYPNPDLAIEIDLSPSKIDRPGIYSALKVAELWRVHDGAIAIEQLDAAGHYFAAELSRYLHVRAEEVTRWVLNERSRDRRDWRRRLQAWILAELKPRALAGGPT
jgi:Uma2 family endonuclease